MIQKIKHSLVLFFIFSNCLIHAFGQPKAVDSSGRGDILELEAAVSKILKETNTPAAGIALVTSAGPVWVSGIGKADVLKGVKADDNTIFRIASVSKMFVALSILKLQENGKLHLEDRVHDLVPEIKFKNRWEKTFPVRIVHLLEHTTGWDEIHLPEIAHNDPNLESLKDALDFHPHSRISRWIPGTRRAYCNSGYAVAAYIVEKISGLKYEDFVKINFLMPLNMNNTTFYNDEVFQKSGAVSYNDKMESIPYRNFIYRPAGGMNSSASDMANFIQLLLNRGALDTVQILSSKSISRMEIPQSTPGARTGLQLGYGLGNATSVYKGFVYHGHDGMIEGGLSELAYLPEYSIGHIFFLNANNSQAFSRISGLIREFETYHLKKIIAQNQITSNHPLDFVSGYYIPINPRNQNGFFLDYLFGFERIEYDQGVVRKSWIFPGQTEKFIPVTDSTFLLENTGKIGMVKSTDPLAGEVLYFDKLVMKHIPGILVFGSLFLAALWAIFTLHGFIMWIAVLINSLIKGIYNQIILCNYTILPGFLYLIIFILIKIGYSDPDRFLAGPGVLSVSLLIVSICILGATPWSIWIIIRSRHHPINGFVYWPMAILSCLNFFPAVYLSIFNVFPIITWN